MVCYMVVSPNPNNGGWAMINDQGKRGFWIKFGDGVFRAAYRTDNPDNLGVENHGHTDDRVFKPSVEGMGVKTEMRVRLGKALEWQYLQWASIVHSETEWHFLAEGTDLPLEQLRQSLQNAMRLFPSLSFGYDIPTSCNNQSTVEFDEIMTLLEDYEATPRSS